MDWEALVPILFFAIPLVISLLDKRAKKQKGVPPVQARPVFPPDAEDEIPEQVRNDNSSPVDFQPVGEVAPENVRLRRTPPNLPVGPLEGLATGAPENLPILGVVQPRVATVFRAGLPDRLIRRSRTFSGATFPTAINRRRRSRRDSVPSTGRRRNRRSRRTGRSRSWRSTRKS